MQYCWKKVFNSTINIKTKINNINSCVEKKQIVMKYSLS